MSCMSLLGPVLAKCSIEAWPGAGAGHMAREEADVLPLLEARLCARQQRDMVWRTLRAMPLRLLERVLPWLAGDTEPTLPLSHHHLLFATTCMEG